MIDAAERLAAERGLNGLSLREVQLASGQRNKSAAAYHFGTRDGLIAAVVAARMGPVNERRTALIATLDAQPAPSLRRWVEALVEPLADATRHPGSNYARFLLQGLADPLMGRVVRESMESASYMNVRARILAELDHLPPSLRERRVDGAVQLMVSTLATWEASRVKPSAAVRRDLVAMCLAVLTAPGNSIAPVTGLNEKRDD